VALAALEMADLWNTLDSADGNVRVSTSAVGNDRKDSS